MIDVIDTWGMSIDRQPGVQEGRIIPAFPESLIWQPIGKPGKSFWRKTLYGNHTPLENSEIL
jgi:hypothetical protein